MSWICASCGTNWSGTAVTACCEGDLEDDGCAFDYGDPTETCGDIESWHRADNPFYRHPFCRHNDDNNWAMMRWYEELTFEWYRRLW